MPESSSWPISGWCVLGDSTELTHDAIRPLAQAAAYGLAGVDPLLPASERYVVALGNAVQASGLGDGIGIDETPEAAKRKVLDYTLRWISEVPSTISKSLASRM